MDVRASVCAFGYERVESNVWTKRRVWMCFVACHLHAATGNIKIIYCLKLWPFILFFFSFFFHSSLSLSLSLYSVRPCQFANWYGVRMCASASATIRQKSGVMKLRQYVCQFMVMSKRRLAFYPNGPCNGFHNCYLMRRIHDNFNIGVFYLFTFNRLMLNPMTCNFHLDSGKCLAHGQFHTKRRTKNNFNYKEIIYAWTNSFCELILHPLRRCSLLNRFHNNESSPLTRASLQTNVSDVVCEWVGEGEGTILLL